MKDIRAERVRRLHNANEIILLISTCGRKFFKHKDRVSKFKMEISGRLWYVDAFSQKKIYMHCPWSSWRGFTEGGTLMSLVKQLKEYIMRDKRLHYSVFGPWPEWICNGDLWGYGDDMEFVREEAFRLGLLDRSSETIVRS